MLHAVHRNPLWGPDVNEFKPERWLDPERMPKNPNLFVGFSIGKRNCIGNAHLKMKVLRLDDLIKIFLMVHLQVEEAAFLLRKQHIG